jgi:hypothetical protein
METFNPAICSWQSSQPSGLIAPSKMIDLSIEASAATQVVSIKRHSDGQPLINATVDRFVHSEFKVFDDGQELGTLSCQAENETPEQILARNHEGDLVACSYKAAPTAEEVSPEGLLDLKVERRSADEVVWRFSSHVGGKSLATLTLPLTRPTQVSLFDEGRLLGTIDCARIPDVAAN